MAAQDQEKKPPEESSALPALTLTHGLPSSGCLFPFCGKDRICLAENPEKRLQHAACFERLGAPIRHVPQSRAGEVANTGAPRLDLLHNVPLTPAPELVAEKLVACALRSDRRRARLHTLPYRRLADSRFEIEGIHLVDDDGDRDFEPGRLAEPEVLFHADQNA